MAAFRDEPYRRRDQDRLTDRRADSSAGRSSEPVDAGEFTAVVTRLRRVLRAAIRADFPWEALPMAQVELLQRLAEQPGLRVRELADRHRLAPNTVSTLIQQMVTAGLVSRRARAGDRRAVTLALTPAGEARLEGWLAAHQRRFRSALDALPPDDRSAIFNALEPLSRLVHLLELGEQAGPGDDDASPAGLPRMLPDRHQGVPQDVQRGVRAGRLPARRPKVEPGR